MKSFLFNELWLLSERAGKARHLEWKTGRNALVGRNHTGKSTVLRMLYYAFGCKTRPLGSEWDRNAAVLVRFSIGEISYRILRRDNMFALFRNDGTLLWATDDHGQLRDQLAQLLRFNLPLTNQKGEPRQARPAFFFLPTFIDQDGSWGSEWDTFESLREFANWQKPTIELALGIRGSEYWQTVSDLSAAKKAAAEIDAQTRAVTDARERLERKWPNVPWFKDALSFRRELKELEEHAGVLAREQDELRNQCVEAASAREALCAQVALLDEALVSHKGDMAFLDRKPIGQNIVCPTCGTPHEHSFFERLNLEAEADELREMRSMLLGQLKRADTRLKDVETSLSSVAGKANAMEELLSRKRGVMKLREIVDRAGVSKAYETLDEQIRNIRESRAAQELTIQELQQKQKALDDTKRRAEIKRRFNAIYSKFAVGLDVPPSLRERSGDIQRKPKQGGSGGPRAVLAYYFALSHIAARYSDEVLPPLVLDSPHANAQDEINRPKVTEFIFRNRVPGQQLIVALEDPPPPSVTLEGEGDKRIDLKKKYGLLQEPEYRHVYQVVEPLVRSAVAHVGTSLF